MHILHMIEIQVGKFTHCQNAVIVLLLFDTTEGKTSREFHSHQLLLLPTGGAVSMQRTQTAQGINQPPNTTLLQNTHSTL